ncbi:SIMPL domain-containing protein [Candidatus Falkowbacteria bacterium]|nr:SIMPL domain-containing protein [Candidatus Falkowbacteria bacterium]
MNQTMQKILGSIGIILGVALTVAACVWAWSLITNVSRQYPPRTASFTGKAIVTVAPDYAEVSASVVTQNTSAQKAQEENDTKVKDLSTYIKANGVADGDIQTTGYNLYPQYDYDYCRRDNASFSGYCPPKITGYEMNQTLTFKVRDLASIGKILGAVTERGANSIYGVTFKVTDPDKVRQRAIAEATQNAKAKAKLYEDATGLRLGKVISVSESGGEYYPMYADGKGGMGGGMMTNSAPIESGSQDITLEVFITYELK